MTNGYMKLTSRRVSFGALIKLVARGSRIRLGTWGILGQHMRRSFKHQVYEFKACGSKLAFHTLLPLPYLCNLNTLQKTEKIWHKWRLFFIYIDHG
jgi:hypothetical protein